MPVLQPYRGGYYLWNYVPSIGAAILFIVLFGIMTAAHCWRIFKTKARFCLPFAIGCLFEFIGYCGRAAAYNSTGKLIPSVIQNFFILVAPALFAASIYMTLGRIIRVVKGEEYSVIRVSRLTKTFVTGDVVSFCIQGGSAGLMVNASTANIGKAMVVTGLVMQILMFGLFALTAVIFQLRLRRKPTSESEMTMAPWRESLRMLYAISVLIMIRSIFRVVEYLMGQSGYPLQHEWTLYIFDSILMLGVTIIFYWKYPSELETKDRYSGELLAV